MGAIGGSLFHGIIGIRNAPKVKFDLVMEVTGDVKRKCLPL